MTLALQILAGLTVPFAASYAVARILGAFIDAGMHPRRGERENQSSRQDGGEGLGAFHRQAIKTILEQDHA